MALNVAKEVFNQYDYMEIAVTHEIKFNTLCYSPRNSDSTTNQRISCDDLGIDDLRAYRSNNTDIIYGLDKGQFSIDKIRWKRLKESELSEVSTLKEKKKINSNNRIFAINFSHHTGLTFDAQGFQLKAMLNDIAEVTQINNFVLIGHSMGGLAARAYIQNELQNQNTNHKIKALITLYHL